MLLDLCRKNEGNPFTTNIWGSGTWNSTRIAHHDVLEQASCFSMTKMTCHAVRLWNPGNLGEFRTNVMFSLILKSRLRDSFVNKSRLRDAQKRKNINETARIFKVQSFWRTILTPYITLKFLNLKSSGKCILIDTVARLLVKIFVSRK